MYAEKLHILCNNINKVVRQNCLNAFFSTFSPPGLCIRSTQAVKEIYNPCTLVIICIKERVSGVH